MKKMLLMLVSVVLVLSFAGCGRSAKFEGTFIHEADDTFGEVVIIHEGGKISLGSDGHIMDAGKVSIKVNGQEYEAKMEDENVILVDGKYRIFEDYCDENGKSDIENCKMIKAHFVKSEWIGGSDEEGSIIVECIKQ